MKRSLIFATLVLIFGIAIGCSESKKSAAPPPGPEPCAGSDCDQECPSDQFWDTVSQSCVISSVDNYQMYDDLSITNGGIWAEFLEAYSTSVTGGFWCRDNKDDGLSYRVGVQDCNTYNSNRTITLNISSLVIAEDDSTQANLVLTARSSYWSQIVGIYLPVSSGTLTAKRYGETVGDEFIPDAGFQMSMTLSGPNGPKVFFLRGDKIDFTDNSGLNVKLYFGDPGNVLSKQFAKAKLYVY